MKFTEILNLKKFWKIDMPNVLLINQKIYFIEWNGLKTSQTSKMERKIHFFFFFWRHPTVQECFVENLKMDK